MTKYSSVEMAEIELLQECIPTKCLTCQLGQEPEDCLPAECEETNKKMARIRKLEERAQQRKN